MSLTLIQLALDDTHTCSFNDQVFQLTGVIHTQLAFQFLISEDEMRSFLLQRTKTYRHKEIIYSYVTCQMKPLNFLLENSTFGGEGGEGEHLQLFFHRGRQFR